jgi:hypothetical protein
MSLLHVCVANVMTFLGTVVVQVEHALRRQVVLDLSARLSVTYRVIRAIHSLWVNSVIVAASASVSINVRLLEVSQIVVWHNLHEDHARLCVDVHVGSGTVYDA